MTRDEIIKFHAELLFKKYGKAYLLTKETSEATDRAVITLQRDRAAKVGIPYTQFGSNKGAGRNVCYYSVIDIATYMLDNQLKVIGA